MNDSTAVLVLVTTASLEEAETISRALVEERLAACVQVSSPLTSVYRWEGKVETAVEWGLSIKTTVDRLKDITEAIGRLHSYETPQLLTVPISGGGRAYLDWLRRQVEPE